MGAIRIGVRLREHEDKLWGKHDPVKAGIFSFMTDRGEIHVVASNGDGWDHVSVSCEYRCPSWEEMEWVKRLFFEEWETAMQLHVPPAEHININPRVLHLWRPHNALIPRPPAEMV